MHKKEDSDKKCNIDIHRQSVMNLLVILGGLVEPKITFNSYYTDVVNVSFTELVCFDNSLHTGRGILWYPP